MEIGVLMGFKTKYTEVKTDVSDVDAQKGYFGYISVEFQTNYEHDKPNRFFMETNELKILEAIRNFFKKQPNYMVEKEIYIDDVHIMINLTRIADKELAADVVQIVKKIEKEFDQKVKDV